MSEVCNGLHGSHWPCRQREEAERVAAELSRQQSDMVTLQAMFRTTAAAPGEQPQGVTLIDGYNLMMKASDIQ